MGGGGGRGSSAHGLCGRTRETSLQPFSLHAGASDSLTVDPAVSRSFCFCERGRLNLMFMSSSPTWTRSSDRCAGLKSSFPLDQLLAAK